MNYIEKEFSQNIFPDVIKSEDESPIETIVKFTIEFDDEGYTTTFEIIWQDRDISEIVNYLNPDLYKEIESEVEIRSTDIMNAEYMESL